MLGQIQVAELRDDLLKALRNNGDWMTRHALGKVLRGGKLYPHDIDVLHSMANEGIIEAENRVIAGKYRKGWVYRVKGE